MRVYSRKHRLRPHPRGAQLQNRQYSSLRLDWIAVVIHSAKGLQSSVGQQKTNPLSLEPLSAGSLGPLSNTGRTTTGTHHEENSFSNGCYSRIHCTFVRAGQNCRSSAAIRCFLVLRRSGYRDDEMSSCQCPACRWWQHEGYRCRSSDTCISGNSFDG